MGLLENPRPARTARAGDIIMLFQGEHIHRWYDEERGFINTRRPSPGQQAPRKEFPKFPTAAIRFHPLFRP